MSFLKEIRLELITNIILNHMNVIIIVIRVIIIIIIITITKYLCPSLCGILDISQLHVGRKSLME